MLLLLWAGVERSSREEEHLLRQCDGEHKQDRALSCQRGIVCDPGV